MTVVFRHRGFRFGFYSNEGEPREPPHVLVSKDGSDAKFRLVPNVELAYNRGYPVRTIREITDIVTARQPFLLEAWNAYFS